MTMRFRRPFLLLLLTILSSFLVLTACTIGTGEDRVRTVLVTVPVVVTATTDPNATPNVIIITATTDRTQVNVPENLVGQGTRDGSGANTLNVTAQSLDLTESVESGVDMPQGCLPHTVAEGDTVFGIADEYGVNPFVMLEVNGMTEETAFLNIGDVLIVPVEGCPIEQIIVQPQTPDEEDVEETEAVEETAEATESANTTPTVTPTITLAPTADDENTDIEIVGIVSGGDVTAEGIRIRNNGRLVDITDWVLTDADGNEYTFGEQLIFSNSELTLYTRTGQDVPIARYWGLETAVWQAGDVVTLVDADGNVQASYRVPVTSSP
jgi:LysM repeat protein